MTTPRTYQYSFGSWLGKLILWLVISTLLASMILDFPNSIFDMLEGTADTADWLRVGGAALLILLIISYAVNFYPNVDVTDAGLQVDFFWGKKFVPWENIVDVIPVGGKVYKSWAVEVTHLTLLHRLYGLLYLKSFARPCFIIFSYLPDHDKLIEKINKEIKKQRLKAPAR